MISAIVLAAGKSSRMGVVNKMLLPFKKSTVVGTVVTTLDQSKVDEIIVVENEEAHIAKHLDENPKLKYVVNKDFEAGLTSSIQCGIKASNSKSEGFLICLGDMPLLTKDDYNLLIDSFLEKIRKVILLPIYNDKRGNPVLFSADFKAEILGLANNTSGCKQVVIANKNNNVEVLFSTNNCHVDIDTMEDYRSLFNDFIS